MRVEPLSDVAGACICGLDLSQALAAETFTLVEAALHDYCFVVFPRQDLSTTQFAAFGRHWGRAEPHVIDTFHHPDNPDILILSNVVQGGKPLGLRDAGTRFANQTRAYAELPQKTRDRIDGLVVRHHYGNRDNLDESSRTVASVLNKGQKKKVDWVQHQLVRPHPHTGVKALYAVSGSSFEILGMDKEAGVALLDELKAHATQPRYQTIHDYAIGDVIVWDNAQLLHAAPLTEIHDPRTLWRITIKEAT